jgi:hypothetical protein
VEMGDGVLGGEMFGVILGARRESRLRFYGLMMGVRLMAGAYARWRVGLGVSGAKSARLRYITERFCVGCCQGIRT